ncbi:hypothetical protein [Solicola gregarius]|uniref:Uncharacterized protein n=1 Tax=Solicola gregarius TaxID=2908642 RepID=A0AA46TI89_9ACTN|nr:hypothetical protein [Solicola gregarius]UYM05842.1 hypothetical protein L0C25_01825 [Solicola gregarius]
MPEKNPDPRPEAELDPGASTQMFQAFVDRHEPEESAVPHSRAVLVGVALVGLVIVLVLAWFLLG